MTLLESVARRLGLPARANRKTRRAASARLALTHLEDRTVPATLTWDGGGGDANWTTAANWVGDITPVASDDLVFGTGAAQLTNTNDFAAGTDFNTITFGGAGYLIYGNSINLISGGTSTFSSGTSELLMDLVFLASPTFDVATGGVFDLLGQISESGGSFDLNKTGGGRLYIGQAASYSGATNIDDGSLTVNAGTILPATSPVTIGGTGNLRLVNGPGSIASLSGSGAVNLGPNTLTVGGDNTSTTYSGVIFGSGGLTKAGAGTLRYTGGNANTYTGVTTVNAGTLVLAKSGSDLAIAGNLVVGTGTTPATVTYEAVNQVADTSAVTVNEGSIIDLGAYTEVVGSLDMTGATFSMTTGLMVPVNAVTTHASTITTGLVSSIQGGTLFLNGNPGLTVTVADDATLATDLSITSVIAAGGIVKNGPGTLALAGANTYTGTTTINAGTLTVTGNFAIADTSAVTVASGATLALSGNETIGSLAGGGDVNLGMNFLTVGADNTGTTFSGVVSGTGNLIKTGTGTFTLSGSNTYTGDTLVNAGTLVVNGDVSGAVTVASGATLGGSGTTPDVTVASAATVAPGDAGPGILSSGNASFVAGSTYSIELNGATVGTQYDQLDVTGTVGLGGSTLNVSLGYGPTVGDTYTIVNNDGADAISGTFNGLAEGASFTIGAATLSVSYVGGDGNDIVLTVTALSYVWDGEGGSRDWTNGVNWVGDIAPTAGADLVFAAGAVTSESVNNFASGTNFNSITVTSSGYDIYGNAIDLTNGITTTYTSGNSAIDLGIALLAGKTFDIAGGGTLTYSGSLSGGFGLTKTGAGTLRYTGGNANTYTGVTTVNAGTLVLAKTAGVNAFGGDLVVGDNTTAAVVNFGINDQIPNAATVTVNEGSLFNVNGGFEQIGDVTIQGGTVTIATGSFLRISSGHSITTLATTNNQTAVISGDGLLDFELGTTTFTIADDADVTIDARVSVAMADGSIVKSGSGVLALDGANTYTGDTLVNDGTLVVNGDVSGAVTVATGATLGGLGQIAGAAVVQSGGTLAPGASPGGLTFDAGLTLASGSSFAVDVNGTTPVSQYDQIFVDGTVDLTGATLTPALGFTPAIGDTFLLIGNDGVDAVTGTFAGLVEGSLITSGATTFRISYVGGDGNDVSLTAVETPSVTGMASANPTTFGQPVTYSVTVTGTVPPTGTVALVIDGTTVETVALVGGVATFSPISNLSAGSHTVAFSYAGDANNLPSGGSLTGGQVVNKAAATATVTTSTNPTVVGQGVTFTATVTSAAGTPTGTVTFLNGTTGQTLGAVALDGNGTASFTTSGLAVGSFRIDVVYSGDGDHNGSSAFVNQSVDPVPTPVPTPAPTPAPTPVPAPVPPVAVSVGTGSGVGGTVQLFDLATGAPTTKLQAYPGYSGEIRVATGDVTGDGVADTITAVGAGPTGGHVKVFDGATGELRFSFYAFPGFSGGVFVTSGDVDGDGYDDIIAAAGAGGGPHVKVFSGKDGSLLRSFLAYDAAFAGGVHVSAGDIDGDGFADIVTGAGAGGGAHVKVFSGADLTVLRSFMAYDAALTGGVYVSAADFDGDGKADIVTGAGAGGAPHVKVFGGADGAVLGSFLAYEPNFRGGVRVGAGVIDGVRAVLAGAGPGGGPHVKAFDLAGGERLSFFAGEEFFTGGVYVG